MKRFIPFLFVLIFCTSVLGINNYISSQVILRNQTTYELETGSKVITYYIVSKNDSNTLWSESINTVLDYGIASNYLGYSSSLLDSYFFDEVEWRLSVDGGTNISFNQTPVPTALVAKVALNVSWNNITGKPDIINISYIDTNFSNLSNRINDLNLSDQTNITNLRNEIISAINDNRTFLLNNINFNASNKANLTGGNIFFNTQNFMNDILIYGNLYAFNGTFLVGIQSNIVNSSMCFSDLSGNCLIKFNTTATIQSYFNTNMNITGDVYNKRNCDVLATDSDGKIICDGDKDSGNYTFGDSNLSVLGYIKGQFTYGEVNTSDQGFLKQVNITSQIAQAQNFTLQVTSGMPNLTFAQIDNGTFIKNGSNNVNFTKLALGDAALPTTDGSLNMSGNLTVKGTNANVGIGISPSKERLTIEGNVNVSGHLNVSGNFSSNYFILRSRGAIQGSQAACVPQPTGSAGLWYSDAGDCTTTFVGMLSSTNGAESYGVYMGGLWGWVMDKSYSTTQIGNLSAGTVTGSTTPLFFVNNQTQKVGIGTGSPTSKLQIKEETSTNTSLIHLTITNGGGSRPFAGIEFSTPASFDGTNAYDSGRLVSGFYTAGSGFSRSGIALQYATGVDTWVDGLVLRGDGNVGIGTDVPSNTLQVEGDVYVGDSLKVVNGIYEASGNITGKNGEFIRIGVVDGNISFHTATDARDYLFIDLDTNSYPEIHGALNGASSLVEFPTGLYTTGTSYAETTFHFRGQVDNDDTSAPVAGGALYINDNVSITSNITLGPSGTNSKIEQATNFGDSTVWYLDEDVDTQGYFQFWNKTGGQPLFTVNLLGQLSTANNIMVGNAAITNYNGFGTGASSYSSSTFLTTGQMNDLNDVFISDDLEVNDKAIFGGYTVGDIAESIQTKRSRENIICDGAAVCTVNESIMAELRFGDLVCIDPSEKYTIMKCTEGNSQLAVGVYSNTTTVLMNPKPGGYNIALAGVVYVHMDATKNPIYPGDLLVSSDIPGYVMVNNTARDGTVVGKSFDFCTEGECEALMFVALS